MLSVPVAVKVLHDKAVEPQALERALHEARLMARLDHPNLLRVFGAGRSVDAVYIVVEYMDGGTLATAGPLGPERAFNVAQQLLSGVQALHDARILHRDIKPANCLVRRQDGRVKLGDLGIAVPFASLDDGNVVWGGTIPFMAPEVLDSERAYSAQSDLYALGMTLLWLVHGKSPIPATLSLGSWVRFGERPHAANLRPDLNPALAALIDRMIAPDPRERPGSAAEAIASVLTVLPSRRPQELHNKRVGHWLLGEVIHCAGDWTAFLATHERTGATARFTRTTAGGLLESSAKKILRLAERASQLQLHGIASVLDWGPIESGAYVVTPPQGLTLEEYVLSAGVCDEREGVEIGIALANALARLHSAGHVYQVVAPEKAVLSADARSAMLGWPVHCVPIGTGTTEAERGEASMRFCIPDHAAPESLYRGIPITTAVDAYGLGSTLYFALTGRAPFGAHSSGAALHDLAHMKSTAPEPLQRFAPTVTQPTASLIAELLAPNAEERPTAASACERLQRIAVQLREAAGSADR
jgi:serine/threonine protein kinase